MDRNSGKLYRQTNLRNGGRKAGYGMKEDDYSEESSGRGRIIPDRYLRVRMPNDDVKPEDLNGPCIIVQEGKKKED